jgi:adenylate kinase family enzyme
MGDRIVIVGNAGGGKSILAKKLSLSRNLPLHRLDSLQWNPGWKPTPEEQFYKAHDAIVETPKWIIDGLASWKSVETRFAAATTIVFVDHPLWVHLWWALKRQVYCIFRPRPDFVEGCPMLPMTGRLFRMILDIHKYLRPKLLDLVQSYADRKEIFHIKSPKELRLFELQYCR